MATYYVNNATGNNGNAGTASGSPWKTLAYAYANSAAGDTINLQTSTWYESVTLGKANQTWKAQTGHTPVLDGRYSDALFGYQGVANRLPPPNSVAAAVVRGYEFMLGISGDGVVVDGLIIQNLGGRAIYIAASGAKVRNCKIDFVYDAGITSGTGGALKTNCEITDNVITRATMKIYDPTRKEVYACTGECASSAIRAGRFSGALVARNVVAYSAGEGIDLGKGNVGLICEDNIVFNCRHAHIYLMWSQDTTVRGNLVYFASNLPQTLNAQDKAPVGIGIRDEREGTSKGFDPQNGVQIYNNVVVGMGYPFLLDGTTNSETRTTRLWVAYNTFVAGPETFKGITMQQPGSGSHAGIFENNVIDFSAAPSSVPISGGTISGGVVFRNNCWSRTPERAQMRGAGDQYGNPNLVNPGATVTAVYSTGPGVPSSNINATNYELTGSSSRCIGQASGGSAAGGVTPPNLTQDYRGATRTTPKDIGAFEFGGVVTNSVAASFTQNRSSGAAPLSVTFTDTSSATGAAVINSWAWAFGDGGTSTQRNPTHVYAAAGSYQATLTVQDTALGLSNSFTGPAITVGGTPTNSVTALFGRSPASGTAPLSVTFTDTSSATGVAVINSWAWAFGDGGTSTLRNPTHNYTTPGSYRATLTVQDTALGLSNSFTGPATTVGGGGADGVTAAFSPSVTTGQAPLSVTFTDTSSATGAAVINSWAWAFGDGGTSTLQNPTHVYAAAGVYRPRLTVQDTVRGLAHSVEGGAITVLAPAAGTNVVIRQTRAALNTSDGTQTITVAGLGGLMPKRATLRVTRATADGTAADGALLGIGFVTGQGNQVACAVAAEHGAATVNAGRRWTGSSCLLVIDSNGAVLCRGTFVAWVADGMQIDLDWTGAGTALLLTVEFAGGTGYQAYAAAAQLGAAGTTVNVNGGFAADAVRLAATWGAQEVGLADATLALGLAHRTGAQYSLERYIQDGLADSKDAGRFYEGRVLECRYGGGGWGNVIVSAWGGQGVTLQARAADINSAALVLLEAFGGAASEVGLLTTQTTVGTQAVELGFAPQAVLHLVSQRTGAGALASSALAGTAGLHTATDDGEFTDTVSGEHGAATTNEQSLSDNAVNVPLHNGSAGLAGTTTLGTTGYSIAFSAVASPGRLWPRLAVEEGTAATGPLTAEYMGWPRSGMTPLAVTFTDLSYPTPTSWDWDFGDGYTSSEANPTHTYREAGVYDVTLTVGDGVHTATLTKTAYVEAMEKLKRRIIVGPYVMRPVTESSGNATTWDATYPEAERGTMSAALELEHLGLSEQPAAPTAEPGVVKVWHDAESGDLKVTRPDGTTGTVDVA